MIVVAFKFNSITILADIKIFTFQTMIPDIFYRTASTFVTAILMENILLFLFTILAIIFNDL